MQKALVDTNYILRLLLNDNAHQNAAVKELFQRAIDGKVVLYTTMIVFFELNWVLSSFYENNKDECIDYLDRILKLNVLSFDGKDTFADALSLYSKFNLSLEDCFNITYYKMENLDIFATFDKKLLNVLNKVYRSTRFKESLQP